MVARQPIARDPTEAQARRGLGPYGAGHITEMLWLLVALTGWTLLALLAAPLVGRVLALDGRPPRRRPVRFHRLAHPLR